MRIFLPILALLLPVSAVFAQEYGTIRATTRLRGDGTTSTTIIDPEKRTAEETIYDGAKKKLRVITHLLGEGDLAFAAIFADGKGNVIYKATYQRDALGRITESSFTAADGRYLGKRLFSYATAGDQGTVQDYDAKGQLITPPAPAGRTSKKRR